MTRAKQIRVAFQATHILAEQKSITTTVSGGEGIFPQPGKNSNERLKIVDRALYAAKASGRN